MRKNLCIGDLVRDVDGIKRGMGLIVGIYKRWQPTNGVVYWVHWFNDEKNRPELEGYLERL